MENWFTKSSGPPEAIKLIAIILLRKDLNDLPKHERRPIVAVWFPRDQLTKRTVGLRTAHVVSVFHREKFPLNGPTAANRRQTVECWEIVLMERVGGWVGNLRGRLKNVTSRD